MDIGFHFIALSSGLPKDSDGDGLPDYLEDRDGDGQYDSGSETDWLNPDPPPIPGPNLFLFTPLENRSN